MKKLYPSGRAMPTRTGSSEPTRSSHATSSEWMTTSHRSRLRVRSISPFYSYHRRAKVGSMSATSKLYDVLKKVDWLAIFSPWAIINRSKMYAMTTKQNTCAGRTPATHVALQNFEKTHEDAEPVVSNRACELSEGNILSSRSQRDTDTSATRTPASNAALKALAIAKPAPICRRGGITVVPKILMVRRAHHDIKANTCATRTAANNAALKGLAIAKGGTTVVPKIVSGEFFGSFFGVKKGRPVAASDGEPMRGGNKGLSVQSEDANRLQRLKTFHTSSSSHLHLLSTIFILLNFGFISATHAQSRQDVGTAEVVEAIDTTVHKVIPVDDSEIIA